MAVKSKSVARNAPEFAVVARLATTVREVKGVLDGFDDGVALFTSRRPHTNKFQQHRIPIGNFIAFKGDVGKYGTLTFYDMGELVKAEGQLDLIPKVPNMFKVTGLGKDGAPVITVFNQNYATAVADGVAEPDAKTGYAPKKPVATATSKKKSAKKEA